METFHITRDENVNAGYGVACITLNNTQSFLVIHYVESGHRAEAAGMSDIHVGWQVVQVNGQTAPSPDEMYDLIAATKKAGKTFSLSITRLMEEGSRNEALLLEHLGQSRD